MKGLFGFCLALFIAVNASAAVRRQVVALTMYFATEVAQKQQHGMLSLGRLSRQLNGR